MVLQISRVKDTWIVWGLEKGWGDTVERCKETLNFLPVFFAASVDDLLIASTLVVVKLE